MNFREIIKENKRNVQNIIKKITNSENKDLEQEVYFKIWKNFDKFKKGNFKGWVTTIAKNVSIDYLKSSKVKNEDSFICDENIFTNIKDKKPNPELRLIQNEREQKILDEINNLKPKLKEVIILTEFYGMTYEDCAKKLKCPIGTVKSRIYNAKKELMEKLHELL